MWNFMKVVDLMSTNSFEMNRVGLTWERDFVPILMVLTPSRRNDLFNVYFTFLFHLHLIFLTCINLSLLGEAIFTFYQCSFGTIGLLHHFFPVFPGRERLSFDVFCSLPSPGSWEKLVLRLISLGHETRLFFKQPLTSRPFPPPANFYSGHRRGIEGSDVICLKMLLRGIHKRHNFMPSFPSPLPLGPSAYNILGSAKKGPVTLAR